MVEVRFYGGVNEIGGNKILLNDRKSDATVFLDFGMSFTTRSQYFEEFMQPRASNGIVDFLEMKLLPNIPQCYRNDLLKFAGLKEHEAPSVDAVILSHAHLDHAAYISFLDERIPVYCSPITHAILKAIHETQFRNIEQEIVDFKARPATTSRSEPVPRQFKIVSGRFRVHGLEMEMIPVDHSIPGANALLVYGSDETIAYSGDLRMHGTDGHLTREFAEKLRISKPDRFLCEGTRIDQTDKFSEGYVRTNGGKLISQTRGLVIADYAYKDTTRFKTFLKIAKSSRRKLALPFKDAYYVRELSTFVKDLPSLSDENILLYQEKRFTGTYRDIDYPNWEREFLNQENTVRSEYVNAHQNEIIIALGYYDLPKLIDIMPQPGSIYLKSASEAINEEQEFDLGRLKAWLNHFGIAYHHFHASGHAPQSDLALIMRESKAKKIVPIHTEHPEMYTQVVKDKPVELPTVAA